MKEYRVSIIGLPSGELSAVCVAHDQRDAAVKFFTADPDFTIARKLGVSPDMLQEIPANHGLDVIVIQHGDIQLKIDDTSTIGRASRKTHTMSFEAEAGTEPTGPCG